MVRRVLGIDPGYGRTGIGILEGKTGLSVQAKLVHYETIETDAKLDYPLRLLQLYRALDTIIATHQPQLAVMETFFYAKNMNNGIRVAEARGVLTLAVAAHNLPLHEMAATRVKQAVTGHGGAKKNQVQTMMQRLLGLAEPIRPDDAADGLALAWAGLGIV